MLQRVETTVMQVSPAGSWLRGLYARWMYPVLTRRSRDAEIEFLNYGYAPLAGESFDLTLETPDERNRQSIQLYQHVASPVDLKDREVLEVSSGHGGGARYIAHYLQPAKYVGLDMNSSAIEYCRDRYDEPGLQFERGNALELPFPDASFDAVVNVEASHCYPDALQFFTEAKRVLRPDGYFLFTDFRAAGEVDQLSRELEYSGLTILTENDISDQVILAMTQTTARRMDQVEKIAPRVLHPFLKHLAGVEGSHFHNSLQNGSQKYLSFTLRKPE